uniref:Uncharacterized protein n=1 Tax=viral metagenome TaxID=1070528 RepID=A0A6M3Y049_9ZZZZ
MTNTAAAQIIKEVMKKYNEYRKTWIENNKTDEGFDEWFTAQVVIK